jgi:hypothetical protein
VPSTRLSVEQRGRNLYVTVAHWPEGSGSDDYVDSCNVAAVGLDGRWHHLLGDALNGRLSDNEGAAKGRVLYLYQWRLGQGYLPTAGLAYHISRSGRGSIQVSAVGTTEDLVAGDTIPAIGLLLLCAQRIALVASLGGGQLQWICKNADQATYAKEVFGFRRKRVLQHGDLLMERSPV